MTDTIKIEDELEETLKEITFKTKTKDEINEACNRAFRQIRELVISRIDDFRTRPELIDRPGEFVRDLKPTTIEAGTRTDTLTRIIDNRRDELQGCINRICITDSAEEFRIMHHSALTYLRRLHDYVMHKHGHIVLKTSEPWRNNLKLD